MRVSPMIVAALATVAGCGGAKSHTPTGTGSQSATSGAPAAPRPPKPKPTHARSPGSLPQTHQLPSASGKRFDSQMASLWRGLESGSVRAALPAFFPLGAYAQVKAIADPRTDYANRLVHEFLLDLAAAHALIGPGARLVGVEVPHGSAHWVSPGACYNRVGYYEVPGSRVVYRQGGQIRSFGIASMISWRGTWYVVHLGAVVRSGDRGVVDQPTVGTGTPRASSTC